MFSSLKRLCYWWTRVSINGLIEANVSLHVWIIVSNKQVRLKITVRNVLLIFWSSVSRDVEQKHAALSESDPLTEQATMSTLYTLLWPQLLSKWQTVWQSQVVEIYHGGPPLKRVTLRPPPACLAGWRQTDLRQTALCPWSCSPLLATPLLSPQGSLLLPASWLSLCSLTRLFLLRWLVVRAEYI